MQMNKTTLPLEQGGSENFSKCSLLGGLVLVSAGKELSRDSLEDPWGRAR